ncbi:MAG: monovalent cation/H(+) antiporter subunit G [Defluviitaleaceae bacterium]|nr:monovalent cation/H(+) antiporter subunit G [Defluviitaleaceae bacterium]MCL2836725.1 monovalent cation/H(+) antiporter subunit G [Defluviitaleaceae bacterium]
MGIENIRHLIGNIIIYIGAAFMVFGVVGLFRLKDFYPRILVASKIDTVGVLTLITGFAIRHGLSFFTGKLFLIMVIMLILNPLVAHIVARSAYLSGHKVNGIAGGTPALPELDENGE